MSKVTIDQLVELFDLFSRKVITSEMIQSLISDSRRFLDTDEPAKEDVESWQKVTRYFFIQDFRIAMQKAIDADDFDLAERVMKEFSAVLPNPGMYLSDIIKIAFRLRHSKIATALIVKASIPVGERVIRSIFCAALDIQDFETARFAASRMKARKSYHAWTKIATITRSKADYEATLAAFERANFDYYDRPRFQRDLEYLGRAIKENEKAALPAKTD